MIWTGEPSRDTLKVDFHHYRKTTAKSRLRRFLLHYHKNQMAPRKARDRGTKEIQYSNWQNSTCQKFPQGRRIQRSAQNARPL